MKPIFRKLLPAALAVAMLAAPLRVFASDALGDNLAAASTALHAQTTLDAGTFWSNTYSDLRQENYVVYTPNSRVAPLVTTGESTTALTSVPAMARRLEEQGRRVVAGVNGDYYGVAHGVPIGSTMADGALKNANGDAYYAVGFRADGTAIIGDPKLSMRAIVNGGSGFQIFAFNHVRQSEYGIFLYDHNFNDRHTTGTSEPGVDVICSCPGGALTIGGTLTMRVEEVLPKATDTAVEEGKYVLTANLRAGEAYAAPLLSLQVGDELTVSVASGAGGGWNEVQNLIGAPELLVENGAVRSGLPTGSAPRTAIGQRADGSLILYTIDGRRSGHSIGASLTAVAMRLVELGCVTAVALDGGGSTTLAATMPDGTSARVVNTPSESGVRAVSNHVFLVAPNTPSGELDHIYLAPETALALPGATVALSAAAIDTNYIPMDASVELSADKGTVSNGALTLPETAGVVTVGARYGGEYAVAKVTVAEPDSIVVKSNGRAVSSLTFAPGESAALTVEAYLRHLKLAGGELFTWTLDGGVGALEGCKLTAADHAAAGSLTVALGENAVTIPVTVSAKPLKTVEDFEAGFETVESENGKTTLSYNTDAAYVRFGRASARLDYTSTSAGDEAYAAKVNYPLASGYGWLSLWLYGDKTQNGASLQIEFDDGAAARSVPLWNGGWQKYAVERPDGATAITGLRVVSDEGEKHGTAYLDQFVLGYADSVDRAAPEIALSLDGEANALAGKVYDAVDGGSLTRLSVTYDGEPIAHGYDAATGLLTAKLPAPDGFAHRVAVVAGDASGNLVRAGADVPMADDAEPFFLDIGGHWAEGAIGHLGRSGVSNGDGTGRYNPDTNITRQEFAALLYRYLGVEGDYAAVETPFADFGTIPGWAKEAARAMYALGVVKGTQRGTKEVYFDPTANISRQEAATMVGRLLEKGYAIPALPYADGADVPDWAADYVALLGAMGAYEGFAGDAFRPAEPITRAQVATVLFKLR